MERPTFSEYWYRIAGLRPRLIAAAQARKQVFRNRVWYVLQSPVNTEYHRMHEAAYGFIALLDGRRTTAEAWHLAGERFGDEAPTQGEALSLVGQLYQANLLMADWPPDAESLFQQYQKRRAREIKHAFASFLFPKFPLWDPNDFLNRWLGLVGWLFSGVGLLLWLVVVALGVHAVLGHWGEVAGGGRTLLSPSNLPWLYVAFILAKLAQELAQAFACKRLGRQEGDAGQVHEMGVMLMMLIPAPYIDATAAWALRSKWRRIGVAAAGIMAGLFVAAVAALVWTRTADGTTAKALAYNLLFVASLGTILFNGNPLLRYDGYFVLCELLEIPNLSQRALQYLQYLVKRHAWGVTNAHSPAHLAFERWAFALYAPCALVYRTLLTAGIILAVAQFAFFIGALAALVTLVMWVGVPFFKLIRYLVSNPELARDRARAVTTTGLFALLVIAFAGAWPWPDRFRIEGVVEPAQWAEVAAGADGYLHDALPDGMQVHPNDSSPAMLATLVNPALDAEWAGLLGKEKELRARMRLAGAREPSAAQGLAEQLAALAEEKARVDARRQALAARAPFGGEWVAPVLTAARGRYFRQGETLGRVQRRGEVLIRATAGQDGAATLIAEAKPELTMRVKHHPDPTWRGALEAVHPAGERRLPSPALGHGGGGATALDPQDPRGATADEHFFAMRIRLEPPADVDSNSNAASAAAAPLPGQVVILRLETKPKPLLIQGYRALRQLFQRRFNI